MNPATEVLQSVAQALDESAIPYMLVGSFVSTYYSQPRATYDIDVVIDPTHEALDLLVQQFDDGITYIGPNPHEALDRQDQFNLIDTSSGWKVDFMMLKDREFDRQQFERARAGAI